MVDRYLGRIGWPTKVTELPDRAGRVPPIDAHSRRVLLDLPPDPTSATGIRAAAPLWHQSGDYSFNPNTLRDSVTRTVVT